MSKDVAKGLTHGIINTANASWMRRTEITGHVVEFYPHVAATEKSLGNLTR